MMKNDGYGLYVHIPFCVRKCNYCDFLSFPADRAGRIEYVQLLAEEMALWSEKASALPADTIFIGGGTPSVLEPEALDIMFQAIHDCFSPVRGCEFTVECNPGTVDREKLCRMRDAGVNRISFGMQSTIDEELRALGRIHTWEDFKKSYELARQLGFSNINVDLMSAIPGQTLESYEKSLTRVVTLSPEHISSYSLIVEEGTPFYELYADNPPVDEENDREMYERTGEVLADAGYERYEISNYSQKGMECRHNLKYWRRCDTLGVGLGASSFLNHRRFQNTASLSEYRERISKKQIPADQTEKLTREEEMSEFMFLGLRCMKGVSIPAFKQEFGEDIFMRYGKALEKFSSQGLLKIEGDSIMLTQRGIDVSNLIFCEFI